MPRITGATLRDMIWKCSCDPCSATRRLEQAGANLVFGKGRHCEIAVVAAAGPKGLLADEAVALRREYAEHLAVPLSGPVQDSDEPVHIQNAIKNYKGRDSAPKNRVINLGKARAEMTAGRYRIKLP